MGSGFLDIVATAGIKAAQVSNNSREMWERQTQARTFDCFTRSEGDFMAARQSFYLASMSDSGWPYIQDRGGPVGLLKVLDKKTVGFTHFHSDRRDFNLGNISVDDRVAPILVDYPACARLKILVRMTAYDLNAGPMLAERLRLPSYNGKPERAFVSWIESFDWNDPQHIILRYTEAGVEAPISPMPN